MRVGIFTDTYSPQINGVVTSIRLMEKMLRKNGHDPFVFTVSHPNAPTDEPDNIIRVKSLQFYGNREHRIGLMFSPIALRKARKLEIDLVHSHAPFSLGIFGHITARRLRIPEVHTYHTMLEDYTHYVKLRQLHPDLIARKYSRVFCNMVNGIIVPTEKVKNKLVSYGVSKPIYLLPTGIELDMFSERISATERTALRTQFHLAEDDFVIAFIGRIAKEKSIEKLICYHRSVIRENPRSKLLIVGPGDHLDALKSLVKQLGLESHIIFTGGQDYRRLPAFYQMSDCFAIASTSETQGLVVVEAMASGLPVVAVDDDSFYPMVDQGKNGFLFKSEEEYVKAIDSLQANGEFYHNCQQAALTKASSFSAQRFYEQLIYVYETVYNDFRDARSY